MRIAVRAIARVHVLIGRASLDCGVLAAQRGDLPRSSVRPGLAPAWPPVAVPGCRAPAAHSRRRARQDARHRPRASTTRSRAAGSIGRAPSSRSAAAWSATSRGLRRPPTCAASGWSRCRRRCWRRWTARSAARSASTCRRARTSSARFTRRRWSSAIRRCCDAAGREFRAGLYEVVKYGVIASRPLFDRVTSRLDAHLRPRPRGAHVASSPSAAASRRRSSLTDERESGLRRVLNFGHTVGHALEAVTRYRRFRHGEAIGYGMLAAARLSVDARHDAQR